jgi:hypothetical protein
VGQVPVSTASVEPCEMHYVSNCSFCRRPRHGVHVAHEAHLSHQRTLTTARHISTCPGCGDRIVPGAPIRAGGHGKWLCMSCSLEEDVE